MSADALQIRIPTGQLRALLTDSGGLAKLESFACEKIAEEIVRKGARIDLAGITRTAEQTVERTISDMTRKWANSYSMPEPVKKELVTACAKEVENQVRTHLTAIETRGKQAGRDLEKAIAASLASVDREIAARVERASTAIKADAKDLFDRELKVLVDAQARQSFIDVLRDVKNETLGMFS